MANLRQVFAALLDVGAVLDQVVADGLFRVGGAVDVVTAGQGQVSVRSLIRSLRVST